MFGQLQNLFGSGAAVPDLSQVGGSPNLGGSLMSQQAMAANGPMYAMPQGLDYEQLLAMLTAANNTQAGMNQPMAQMPMAPMPTLQAGGEAFGRPYQDRRISRQQAQQGQPGLLGGAYGVI